MKHRKQTIMISLVVIILLVSGIFSVVFNVYMHKYIDEEAKKTIRKDVLLNSPDESIAYDALKKTYTFVSTILYVDNDYRVSRDKYVRQVDYDHDMELLMECRRNKADLEMGEILVFSLSGGRYYVAKTWGLPDLGEQVESAIVYINTSPVQRLIQSINLIFALVVFVLTLIVSVLGLKAAEILDDSDRKMQQFFQNASHELKTPIMAIQGYAEGIEKNIIPEYWKAARVILNESDKMEALVNEILELAKFESGMMKPKFQTVNVSELLYEVMERIIYSAQTKGIEFTIDVEDITVANCDSELLERVFLNILKNALRYAEKDVAVTCKKQGDYIVVVIADDGDSLSKEDARHVFDRFYQGEKGSTGLGLALAKEIVDLHKGKILVEVETGTSFVVKLPIT